MPAMLLAPYSGSDYINKGTHVNVPILDSVVKASHQNHSPQPFTAPPEANPKLCSQIRRIDAVDGKWLRLLDDAVAEVVDEYALDKAAGGGGRPELAAFLLEF